MQALLLAVKAGAGELARGVSTGLVVWASSQTCPSCTCSCPGLHCPDCICRGGDRVAAPACPQPPWELIIAFFFAAFFVGVLAGLRIRIVKGTPVPQSQSFRIQDSAVEDIRTEAAQQIAHLRQRHDASVGDVVLGQVRGARGTSLA